MREALARDTDLTASGTWSIRTMRDYFLTLISANDARYKEQFAATERSIQAADLRHEQRFNSQESSVVLSFSAQEKAVATALQAQEKLVSAQFTAIRDMIQLSISDRMELAETKHDAIYHAIAAVKSELAMAIANAEKAVGKAETSTEARFSSVNEFRNTLGDQQRTFIPRAEVEVIIRGLEARIASNVVLIADQNTRMSALAAGESGKASGVTVGWGYAIGALGLITTVLTIAFHVMKL